MLFVNRNAVKKAIWYNFWQNFLCCWFLFQILTVSKSDNTVLYLFSHFNLDHRRRQKIAWRLHFFWRLRRLLPLGRGFVVLSSPPSLPLITQMLTAISRTLANFFYPTRSTNGVYLFLFIRDTPCILLIVREGNCPLSPPAQFVEIATIHPDFSVWMFLLMLPEEF